MDPAVTQWYADGQPVDPTGVPHQVKQHLIRSYAQEYGLDQFVETGTCHGAMVLALVDDFKSIATIEMFLPNWRISKRKLAEHRHVVCLHGDSGTLLAEVVSALDRPALFFLDAHYSGGGTARGAVDTPVMNELAIIATSPHQNVVVIDDARLFEGCEYHTEDFSDYPSRAQIEAFLHASWPHRYKLAHVGDEFVVTPERQEA